jgi:hypothetical protein
VERRELGDTQRMLIKRPDRRRPDRPLTVSIFGRPLTFGGRYTFLTEYKPNRLLDFDHNDADNKDLDGDGDVTEPEDAARGQLETDDRLRINQSLELDLLFSFSENISAYVEGRIGWLNQVVSREREFSEWQFERAESWLFLGNLLDTPLSLQIGRQRYSDEREWWWDSNIDSIRLRVDQPDFHAQVSVGEQLFRVSADEDFIIPEEKDVLRVLGQASWRWGKRQQVGFYALHQNDRSDGHTPGRCLRDVNQNGVLDPIEINFPSAFNLVGCIDPDHEDESDADLTWFGISAEGRWKLDRPGRIYYWLNAAGVIGKETFYDTAGPTRPVLERRVDSVNTHDVAGWGIDLGATLQTNLFGRPNFTLGYAYGSGGSRDGEEFQNGFRQTGLQDNNGKFRGVASFRYYGELFDPELWNLHILTAGFGFRFLRNSSFDLVYHYYHQDTATTFFRDVGFKRDPDGLHRSVGHEWDAIIGIEEWGPLELKLVGSVFRGGKTFAPDDGVLSYLGTLRLRLTF